MAHNSIRIVEKLIETCRDGEKGYQDAAAHVKRPDLKSYFEAQSAECRRFAVELQAGLSKLGKPKKKESGSVSAVLHRAWIDAKAILGARGQIHLRFSGARWDRAKEVYEETLIGLKLDVSLASLVQRQAEDRNFRPKEGGTDSSSA
ncbi:MAG: hypothetical protein NVS1B11_29140 [Terriglobales bacterium]